MMNFKMPNRRYCIQDLKLNINAGLVRNASKGCPPTSFSYFTSAINIQAPMPFNINCQIILGTKNTVVTNINYNKSSTIGSKLHELNVYWLLKVKKP